MTNKNLLLVHGAWSSKNSFNYVIQKVLDNNNKVGKISCFEYDCQKTSLRVIGAELNHHISKLSMNGLKTIMVGHSLGGILAIQNTEHPQIEKTITLASPLSGTKYNMLLHWYLSYHSPVIAELLPTSKYIDMLHSKRYTTPIDVMVATKGFNPMIYEPSDGVITISSQINWVPNTATIYDVPVNHNEILLAPRTIIQIEKALNHNDLDGMFTGDK